MPMPRNYRCPLVLIVVILSLASVAVWVTRFNGDTLIMPPDATLPDGSKYFGELHNGKFHGQGKLVWMNGAHYEGSFVDGVFSGQGVIVYVDGTRYEGDFRNGSLHGEGILTYPNGLIYSGEFRDDMPHGKLTITYTDGAQYVGDVVEFQRHGQGRLTDALGNIYEGQFEDDQIISGRFTNADGETYQGNFKDWNFHGDGEYTDVAGTRYLGQFEEGSLNGEGTVLQVDGSIYDGELANWQYSGAGVLTDAKGNRYSGDFTWGMYHGEGEMVYAEPVDGITTVSGKWEYGRPVKEKDPQAEKQRKVQLEKALYVQTQRFRDSQQQLREGDPDTVDLYMLNIAGDGSQDVFLKEIRFIEKLFADHFGTDQRSLSLSNNFETLDTLPLASRTSLDSSLQALAEKMNPQQDVLFLYMTSHGSKDHQFSIKLPGVTLPSISAEELAQSLKDSGIKWKVIVISACYSGGFIPLLQDDNTLVMTAAREDRTSFGCGDDSDMTYFGRAYFEQALLKSASFSEAFHTASTLIEQRENEEQPEEKHSEPQMWAGKNIEAYLKLWWPLESEAQNP